MSFFFNPDEFTDKKVKHGSFLADPCKICGMYKNCESPKMEPYGDNSEHIFVLGEAPGKKEDEKGRGFIGKSGNYLDDTLNELGIDFAMDCVRSNVLQCKPVNNKFLSEKVEYCYPRLEEQIKKYKPKLILCFGMEAIKRILETDVLPSRLESIHGMVFPSKKYKCYVSCNYHPAYIMRIGESKDFGGKPEYNDIFIRDIEKALEYLDKSVKDITNILDSKHDEVLNEEEAILFLKSITGKYNTEWALDFETNQLSPFKDNAKLISMSLCNDPLKSYCIPLEGISDKLIVAIVKFIKNSQVSCHSGKFDSIWSANLLGTFLDNRTYDTILAAHVLDERRDIKSLEFQSYLYTGEEYKGMVDRKNMDNADRATVYKYNNYDAKFTKYISIQQKKELIKEGLDIPTDFLLKGSRALERLEYNGVQIDEKAFYAYRDSMDKMHKETLITLNSNPLIEQFNKEKHLFDVNKNNDLKILFFDMFGAQPISETAKGSPQVNEELFNAYKEDPDIGSICSSILTYKAINKMKTTYINAIEKYVDSNWILHPTYNLWVARTFRSSCDNPNLQNVPKRDESQVEFRKIFIPRYDYLLDADHKGSEVVIQALLAKDKVLIGQLKDGMDPHRYWGSRLYQVSEEKLSKKQRYNAKNGFVFPLIYGSYYRTIAANLNLSESHVKDCEDEFFSLYKGIARYQKDKEKEYEKYGYVTTPLGFKRRGPLSRNQIVNTPIQATSFHYLLDTLTELVLYSLKEYNIKSIPVLQIHDDIVMDVKEKEIDTIIQILNDLTQNKPYFNWVKDISINVEYSIGKNWLEMEALSA